MNRINELIQRYPQLKYMEDTIESAAKKICESVSNGHKIMVCGNGGSASDAEHIVGEFMKNFILNRPISDEAAKAIIESDDNPRDLLLNLQQAIPAISLNSQTSLITAITNDTDSSMIYAQQLYGYGKKGDVLIALSTSGNSKNVLNAVRVAKALGVEVIFIGGKSGGEIAKKSNFAICLPDERTYVIQEYTLPIYHAICMYVEEFFFLDSKANSKKIDYNKPL